MRMKYLIFAILLGACRHVTTDDKTESADFVQKLNKLRQDIGKDYNIPYMHQVTWSDELNEIMKQLNWTHATWPQAGVNWRYGSADSYTETGAESIRKKSVEFLKDEKHMTEVISTHESLRTPQTASIWNLELIHPLQSMIACESVPEKTYKGCLLGPIGKWIRFGFGNPVWSEGCRCGFDFNDGLCRPSSGFSDSLLGDEICFVSEVNDRRRRLANSLNVPNMHQLVWDEDLAKFAAGQTGNNRTSDSNWRYVELISYTYGPLQMEINRGDLMKKSVADRKEYFKTHESNWVGAVEIFNPLQQKLGCSFTAKEDNVNRKLICLLGPQSDFDITFEQGTASAGSMCNDQYVNDDGLCSVPKAETPKPDVQSKPTNSKLNNSKPNNSNSSKTNAEKHKEEGKEGEEDNSTAKNSILFIASVSLIFMLFV